MQPQRLSIPIDIKNLDLWKDTISLLKEIAETTKDPEILNKILDFVDSRVDNDGDS